MGPAGLVSLDDSEAMLLSQAGIDNNDDDAVTGTFDGLPEGSQISFGGGTLYITYQGGDGNDVVLTTNVAPTADTGGPYPVDEGSSVMLDGSASLDPNQSSGTLIYEWDFDLDGVPFAMVQEALPDGRRGGDAPLRRVRLFRRHDFVDDLLAIAGMAETDGGAQSNLVVGDLVEIDHVELACKGRVPKAALGQPAVQRHLAALEAFDAHAGARGLALAAAATGLAHAGADAAADAHALLARPGAIGELMKLHGTVLALQWLLWLYDSNQVLDLGQHAAGLRRVRHLRNPPNAIEAEPDQGCSLRMMAPNRAAGLLDLDYSIGLAHVVLPQRVA
jgi:hypothetical protein